MLDLVSFETSVEQKKYCSIALLDAMARRKISSLSREWYTRTPIVQPIAQRYPD
jgi:hypothetical protein